MKKIGRDKPIGLIPHVYREISQGNSLCSYFYLKQANIIIFFFLSFFFYKIREQEVGTSLPVGGGVGTNERGRWWKGVGR
jgi:hypothetical protein